MRPCSLKLAHSVHIAEVDGEEAENVNQQHWWYAVSYRSELSGRALRNLPWPGPVWSKV